MKTAMQLLGYVMATLCAYCVDAEDYGWAAWFGMCAIHAWFIMVMPKDKK